MMNTISDEYFEVSAVEHHRYVYGNFLVGITHEPVDAFFKPQLFSGYFEASLGRFVYIQLIVRR